MKRLGFKGLAVGAIVTSVVVSVAAFSATTPPTLVALRSTAVVTGPLSATTLGNTPISAGPANRVNGGDIITWTDEYQNVGTKVASGSITQTFAPNRASYVPNSVVVPDGWKADVITAAGRVTAVKASADFVPADGRSGVATRINPPTVTSISTSIGGGGDSFELLFHKQNIYSALHHTTLKVLCFNKNDGSSCGSFGPSRTLFSSDLTDAWVDQATGKAYFPAIDRAGGKNRVVMSCLDFGTKSDCGITELDADGVSLSAALVSQPWMFNGEVMFVYPRNTTKELMVGCVTAATMVPCAGQPFSAGLATKTSITTASSRKTNVYWSADGTTPYRAGGLVSYTRVADGTNALSLECFDSANRTACAGQTEVAWDGGQDPVLRSDSAGLLRGFCARPKMTGGVACFDLAGNAQAVPASFEAWLPKTRVSWNGVLGGYGLMSNARSYIPLSATNPETVPCYDWNTGTSCDGFPFVSSVSHKSYSLRRDPAAPTCMWKMSDDGFLESFHADGGPAGCTSGTISAKPVYCADDASLHVTGWDALRLNDLPAGAHNGFAVTLKDSTGAVVPGWSARKFGATTNVVDISSILFSGTRKALTADIAFSGLKASAFASATPTMEISWKGDPLRVCTRTVVNAYCPQPYSAIDAAAIFVKSEAETGGVVSGSATPAFDYITSAICGVPVLEVLATINGEHRPIDNPLDVRSNLTQTIRYTVSNAHGTVALANPKLVDDAGSSGINDDHLVTFLSGDDNHNNILDIGEIWTYSGAPDGGLGLHHLHPVFTGDPIDQFEKPAGKAVSKEDSAYYFVSEPALGLFVGIYEGHSGGGGCRGFAELAAAPSADITYCYVVTNNGSVDLQHITISDPALGITQDDLTTLSGSRDLLPVHASMTLYFETTNKGDRTTHVIAMGTPPDGVPVSATSDSTLGPRQLPAT
jgi:hypothetical protein